ncbi:MAG: hypothetical protein A2342_09325 [Gallionellales bacterium RIFOXYB12_FULL_54_9]|nr:MAG: hypothetical protein A2342_09325 [Gallionellales bacterium RIFOXYB12_FULL_54_9]
MKNIVKREGRRVKGAELLSVACLLWPVYSLAEELIDPTMPPARIAMPVVEAAVAEIKPPGLQSILIGKQRRAAIIDGETVELGGIHGAAKLIEVNEGNVVLRGAQGRQVLSLFPDVSKISQKVLAEPAQSGAKIEAKKINTHSPREKK